MQLALRVKGIERVAAANPQASFEFLDEGEWNLARDGFMIAQRLANQPADRRPDFILALTDVLATGVIASVINQMGSMVGNNVFGVIVFILVFCFGHLFNLAINLLGAYVHTCRLQYVEFFGKFYEGGGKAFRPFKQITKYVEIKED